MNDKRFLQKRRFVKFDVRFKVLQFLFSYNVATTPIILVTLFQVFTVLFNPLTISIKTRNRISIIFFIRNVIIVFLIIYYRQRHLVLTVKIGSKISKCYSTIDVTIKHKHLLILNYSQEPIQSTLLIILLVMLYIYIMCIFTSKYYGNIL